jgi:hypothetical protein
VLNYAISRIETVPGVIIYITLLKFKEFKIQAKQEKNQDKNNSKLDESIK